MATDSIIDALPSPLDAAPPTPLIRPGGAGDWLTALLTGVDDDATLYELRLCCTLLCILALLLGVIALVWHARHDVLEAVYTTDGEFEISADKLVQAVNRITVGVSHAVALRKYDRVLGAGPESLESDMAVPAGALGGRFRAAPTPATAAKPPVHPSTLMTPNPRGRSGSGGMLTGGLPSIGRRVGASAAVGAATFTAALPASERLDSAETVAVASVLDAATTPAAATEDVGDDATGLATASRRDSLVSSSHDGSSARSRTSSSSYADSLFSGVDGERDREDGAAERDSLLYDGEEGGEDALRTADDRPTPVRIGGGRDGAPGARLLSALALQQNGHPYPLGAGGGSSLSGRATQALSRGSSPSPAAAARARRRSATGVLLGLAAFVVTETAALAAAASEHKGEEEEAADGGLTTGDSVFVSDGVREGRGASTPRHFDPIEGDGGAAPVLMLKTSRSLEGLFSTAAAEQAAGKQRQEKAERQVASTAPLVD